MKITLTYAALALSSALAFKPAVHENIVESINAANSGWKAHLSPRFEGESIEHVKALCGTFTDPEVLQVIPSKAEQFPEEVFELSKKADIPTEFDARQEFPECSNIIGHVHDQANCGSCWAVSSTAAFNDRLCIASNGEFQQLLSAQDTVNCCGYRNCQSMGCNGGQPGMAWRWFKKHGVVSGGDFQDIGSGDSCIPYQYSSTDYRPKEMECKGGCLEEEYQIPYKEDKHFGSSYYSLDTVEAMQRDIMEYGSITGGFIVYQDFPHYESGIYRHVHGGIAGGHAIKIIGWGTEDGEDYWIVVNSWTDSWGEKGTFRILRGVDECKIESLAVHGGHVKYTQQM